MRTETTREQVPYDRTTFICELNDRKSQLDCLEKFLEAQTAP